MFSFVPSIVVRMKYYASFSKKSDGKSKLEKCVPRLFFASHVFFFIKKKIFEKVGVEGNINLDF
jgi:hypothetical protein